MADVCFSTLAIGSEFRALASLLAGDLAVAAPDCPLLILTDDPQTFHNEPNVIAVPHIQRSLWRPYHDKRFVVAEALKRSEVCIYLDADSRVDGQIPLSFLSNPPEGLVADIAIPMVSRHQSEIEDGRTNPRRLGPSPPTREWHLVQRAHRKWRLDPVRTYFVREHLFLVRRNGGVEHLFLSHWAALAWYFETRGLTRAEGNAIGMAAALVGWPVRNGMRAEEWYFKDIRSRLDSYPAARLATVRRYSEKRALIAQSHFRESTRVAILFRGLARLVKRLTEGPSD